MFRVDDIYDEAKKIIGVCDDALLFAWCGDVVTMIANKADFEGFKGWLDICTGTSCGKCITLPREVEVVLGVNIGGRPALGFDQLFNFHLNGPGDCNTSCEWSWQDQGNWHPTYRDLVTPSKLVVYLQTAEDNGKQFIVYGYDSAGQVLRRQVNGVWLDGYQVPTIYGVAVPDSQAPTIGRITSIYKDSSAGSMRLSTIDNGGNAGTLLGVYEPDEKIPQFRRIKINRSASWVRVAYMRSSPVFSSRYNHIPLRSRVGFLLGMDARKFYKDRKIAEAHSYEADAARLELEAQAKVEPPTYAPPQVIDRATNLRDRHDYDIR
jgi:hypothetical protein